MRNIRLVLELNHRLSISFSDTKNGWCMVGTTPCAWNFGPDWPHSSKNTDFQSIFALYPLSEWAYDEHRMLLLLNPKGAKKCKMAVFHLKLHFSERKSTTKFICVKTVGDKVVRPNYPCKNDWWGRPLLCDKFGKTDPPPSKMPIFNRVSLLVPRP